MSRKIVGATVGTPLNPKKIEEFVSWVKSVNGAFPDEKGNVDILSNCFLYFGKTIPEDAPAGSIVIDLSGQDAAGVSKEMLEAIVAEALKNGVDAIVDEVVQDAVKDITPEQIGALPDTTVIPVVPAALPNPFALTFTGAVESSYDGSKPLEVNIPMGGGSDKWEFIGEFNVGKADVAEWIIDKDKEDKPIELKKMYIERVFKPSSATTANTKMSLGNPAFNYPFGANETIANTTSWISTSSSNPASGNGWHFDWLPNGEYNAFVRAYYHASSQNGTWSVGRGAIKAGAKNCIGGLGLQSQNPSTGLIGAGSIIKMWGVRI